MKIKVIGSGCSTCKKLHGLAVEAVKAIGLETEVVYSNDINEAIKLGAMQMPVLVINNKIVMSGLVPDVEKIKEKIKNSL